MKFKKISKRMMAILLATCVSITMFPFANVHALAYQNGKEFETVESRKTPVMGWSSWNAYLEDITEDKLIKEMDTLVELGLAESGYNYFYVDDGYQNGRDTATGRLKINEEKFPNGMKVIADAAHERGLKAGIYTDAGEDTCSAKNYYQVNGVWPDYGMKVGVYGHEEDDINMFLGTGKYLDTYAKNGGDSGIDCWGFDAIKVDWCGGSKLNLDKRLQYTKIGNEIKKVETKSKRDLILDICCWGYYGSWMLDVGDSWRILTDLQHDGTNFGDENAGSNNLSSVMAQVDFMKSSSYLTGPGHVNHPDMLVVGKGLTAEEDKTHFGLWCMFSAPLIIGSKLGDIANKPDTLALLKNEDLIAIDQDSACLSAAYIGDIGNRVEVWSKPLGSADSDTKAIALVNRLSTPQTVTYNFADLGYSGKVAIRDLFAQKDIGEDTTYTVTLAAHQSAILKLTPTEKEPNVAISSSVLSVNDDVTLSGNAGENFEIFTQGTQNGVIKISTEGDSSTYKTAVAYNSVNEGLHLTGETPKFTVTLPQTETETIANLYLGGNGNAIVTAEIGGKTAQKVISLDGTAKKYSIRYNSDYGEQLTLTVMGDIYVDAISFSTDVNVLANATFEEMSANTNINLTQKGTEDWLYHGNIGDGYGVSKANGANQIKVFASTGEYVLEKYGGNDTTTTYTWTDGDAVATKTNIKSTLFISGEGNKYTVLLPADGQERKVEMPIGALKSKVTVDFSVGGKKVYSDYVEGTNNTYDETKTHYRPRGDSTNKYFTATYSSDKQSVAKIEITVNNLDGEDIYWCSAAIGGIALSLTGASEDTFSHISTGLGIENFDATVGAVDYVKHGESEGTADILWDPFTFGGADEYTLENYGEGFEIPLPNVNGLTRVDLIFEVRNAAVGISTYAGEQIEYNTFSDINGGTIGAVSVWYSKGMKAKIKLDIKSMLASTGNVTLKSLSLYENITETYDYPSLSEENGVITATIKGMNIGNTKDVKLVTDFYNGETLFNTVSNNITLGTTLAEYNSQIAVPTGFTSGKIKVYVTDVDGTNIGKISGYDYPLTSSISKVDTENKIGGFTAHYLVEKKNAVLLDVRTPEEYNAGHLSGAVNLEYTSISEIVNMYPNKDTTFVVYCSAGKRSAQAVIGLAALGYKNTYNLGDYANYGESPSIKLPNVILTGNIVYPEFNTIPDNDKDRIKVKYSLGDNSTLSDAVDYNEKTGIAVEGSGENITVKAYLVLALNGKEIVIAEASQSYASASYMQKFVLNNDSVIWDWSAYHSIGILEAGIRYVYEIDYEIDNFNGGSGDVEMRPSNNAGWAWYINWYKKEYVSEANFQSSYENGHGICSFTIPQALGTQEFRMYLYIHGAYENDVLYTHNPKLYRADDPTKTNLLTKGNNVADWKVANYASDEAYAVTASDVEYDNRFETNLLKKVQVSKPNTNMSAITFSTDLMSLEKGTYTFKVRLDSVNAYNNRVPNLEVMWTRPDGYEQQLTDSGKYGKGGTVSVVKDADSNLYTATIDVLQDSADCKLRARNYINKNGSFTAYDVEFYRTDDETQGSLLSSAQSRIEGWNVGVVDGPKDVTKGYVAYKEIITGDANDDGTVNILDLVCIKKRLAGMKLVSFARYNADMDKNGKEDSVDLVEIIKYLLSK